MSEAIHPFTAAGLGEAPFRCIGVFSMPSPSLGEQNPHAYQRAMRDMPRGFGVGTCGFCGVGLVHNYLVRSKDGRTFSVGCDCVAKTNDAELKSKAETLKKQIEAKARRTRADARKAKRDAERRAKIEAARAERDVAEAVEAEKREAARADCTAENAWLISVLRSKAKASSPFCLDMARHLETRTFREMALSDRAVAILRDIYAKAHGRHGSHKYTAAAADFDARTA